jgi:hypothetical protein
VPFCALSGGGRLERPHTRVLGPDQWPRWWPVSPCVALSKSIRQDQLSSSCVPPLTWSYMLSDVRVESLHMPWHRKRAKCHLTLLHHAVSRRLAASSLGRGMLSFGVFVVAQRWTTWGSSSSNASGVPDVTTGLPQSLPLSHLYTVLCPLERFNGLCLSDFLHGTGHVQIDELTLVPRAEISPRRNTIDVKPKSNNGPDSIWQSLI